MELESTVYFKEVDVDAMLQHTTIDELMKSLYVSKGKGTTAEELEKQMRESGDMPFLEGHEKKEQEDPLANLGL